MRKLIALALIAVAIVALAAAPAFAEGYNNSGINFNYPDGSGGYLANPSGAYASNAGFYTRASGFFSGPHGGYTTTTNKCQDCHSTHYATGSYKLLRANSAAAACDFCHAGGGGSTVNVQMDNDYDAVSSVATTTMGYGTGHTLGYEGNAPADIQPAFSAGSEGFACFSCHSPHGNSARILTTFSDPGRAFVGPGQQGRPTTSQLQTSGVNPTVDDAEKWVIKTTPGDTDDDGLLDFGEWGVDAQYGNFVWYQNVAGTGMRFRYRPIWPSGRFLLLKNPHSDAAEGGNADTVVTSALNETAENGVNKYAINWTEPLGPADGSYGGYQDNDNDNAFPFAPATGTSPTGTGGFLSQSEFCTDCHDGAAGVSTQPARVWKPDASDSTTGTYMVAYSHDAQPRH